MKLLPPPGPERRSQLTRLGVMLVILAALGVYQFGLSSSPVAPATVPLNVAAPGAIAPTTQPTPIGLEKLEIVAENAAAGRNPFGYGQPPPPPAPPPMPAPPPPVQTAPPPPPVPQAPDIPLKLIMLGQIVTGGPAVATLKDTQTNALYLAVEGQIIDGRYKLAKVGQTSVIVSYLDGSGQKMLPLG
ncbi:MAG TPA: hypothetical protein VFV98_11965 [Vicinamibacterales bacterium]|nr:hypothetical protein [Vicinamibacterales bacterium]